jgi:hypothetical protein
MRQSHFVVICTSSRLVSNLSNLQTRLYRYYKLHHEEQGVLNRVTKNSLVNATLFILLVQKDGPQQNYQIWTALRRYFDIAVISPFHFSSSGFRDVIGLPFVVKGDRREPDVFEMDSTKQLGVVGSGTRYYSPRYRMPFQWLWSSGP